LETLERLTRTTHVLLDKTGTLTSGVIEVVEIVISPAWCGNWKTFCLFVACAEEQQSSFHPISKAIFKAVFPHVSDIWSTTVERSFTRHEVENSANGVSCRVSYLNTTSTVILGNAVLMASHGISPDSTISIGRPDQLQVYVALNEKHIATIFLKVFAAIER